MKNLITILSITAISFSAHTQVLPAPNGDFELWTDDNPDQWFTFESTGDEPAISQVAGNGGGSAVMGIVVDYPVPILTTGPDQNDSFPIDTQYAYCVFDYKFHNASGASGDGLFVSIALEDGDSCGVAYNTVWLNAEVTTFTTYSLPIDYFGSSCTATIARIYVDIFNGQGESLTEGSYYIIDNVSLSGTAVDMAEPLAQTDMEVSLSPNPCTEHTVLTINLQNASSLDCTITDISGREVSHFSTGLLNAGENSVEVDTQGLEGGVYLVRVETNTGNFIERLVAQN